MVQGSGYSPGAFEFNVSVQLFQLCPTIPPSFKGDIIFLSFKVIIYFFPNFLKASLL